MQFLLNVHDTIKNRKNVILWLDWCICIDILFHVYIMKLFLFFFVFFGVIFLRYPICQMNYKKALSIKWHENISTAFSNDPHQSIIWKNILNHKLIKMWNFFRMNKFGENLTSYNWFLTSFEPKNWFKYVNFLINPFTTDDRNLYHFISILFIYLEEYFFSFFFKRTSECSKMLKTYLLDQHTLLKT